MRSEGNISHRRPARAPSLMASIVGRFARRYTGSQCGPDERKAKNFSHSALRWLPTTLLRAIDDEFSEPPLESWRS